MHLPYTLCIFAATLHTVTAYFQHYTRPFPPTTLARQVLRQRRQLPTHDIASSISEPRQVEGEHTTSIRANPDHTWFMVSVHIGTSSRSLNLAVDTGSVETWISSSKFGQGESSTFQTTNESFHIQYIGGVATGIVAKDTVHIAGYSVAASFGYVNNTSLDCDGIMGFARSPSAGFSSIMDSLSKQRKLEHTILGVRVPRGDEDGDITIGDVNFQPQYSKATYFKADPPPYWRIAADDVLLDGKQLGLRGTAALIDTGTAWSLMGEEDAKTINQAMGGRQDAGHWVIPCAQQRHMQIAFSGVAYTVQTQDYVGPESGPGMCYSKFQGGSDGVTSWILGDNFLANVYAIYDSDKERIGFATLPGQPAAVTSGSISSKFSAISLLILAATAIVSVLIFFGKLT